MKTIEKRLEDEQKFHNEIFESDKRSEEVGRFYAITDRIHKDYEKAIFDEPDGKVVLEYGCGMAKGNRVVRLAKKGAEVHGIDISDFAIAHLTKEAQEQQLDIDYRVMNAEAMTYANNTFDTIYGSGILHHLDLNRAFKSIADKLKPSGKAVFIEPLGHNPIINGFRDKTPDIRTEDEHPLLMKDFKLAHHYFNKVAIKYYYLSTLAVPLVFGKNPPKLAVRMCDGIDRAIFGIFPFMRKYAWQVLVTFSEPR